MTLSVGVATNGALDVTTSSPPSYHALLVLHRHSIDERLREETLLASSNILLHYSTIEARMRNDDFSLGVVTCHGERRHGPSLAIRTFWFKASCICTAMSTRTFSTELQGMNVDGPSSVPGHMRGGPRKRLDKQRSSLRLRISLFAAPF